MAIKEIVNLVDLDGHRASTQIAIDLATITDSHVTGIATTVDPVLPGINALAIPADYMEISVKQTEDAINNALNEFSKLATKANARFETRAIKMISGGAAEPLLANCRLTDLLVVGQDNPDEPEPMREFIIESMLFDSGIPVLVVPYIYSSGLSHKHAMIAWDGSKTATRAIHASIPLLGLFEKTTIVMVQHSDQSDDQMGADLAKYLARHGANVLVNTIHKPPVNTTTAILNYISDEGVDLVIMGGYGHSRMRELILGGVTKGMLDSMTVPVLMAH